MISRSFFLAAAMLLFCAVSCSGSRSDQALAAYVQASEAYGSGSLALAKALATKAVSLDSGLAPAWTLAGKADFIAGDYPGAVNNLLHAYEINHSSVETRLWLARSYASLNKPDKRKKLLKSLLADDPGNPVALRMLAFDAAKEGDTKSSRMLLDNAADAAVELGMVFLDRAALRWAADDFSGTMADLDRSVALLPEKSVAASGAEELRKRVLEARK